jgi:hypothetical protein
MIKILVNSYILRKPTVKNPSTTILASQFIQNIHVFIMIAYILLGVWIFVDDVL